MYEFAKNWVNDGHQVTVVTAVYSKSDIVSNKFFEKQEIEGINLRVINVEINNKHGIFRRIWSFVCYTLIASICALTLKYDISVASSGPITIGIPGLIAKYVRKKKFVFEVRDLWPQGAVELGILKNPLVKQLAYWFESVCYDSADLIVTLSPGMTEDILSRFGKRNITTVTNGADVNLFKGDIVKPSCKVTKFGSYAIYTGNIGEVNNSLWLLDTARILHKLNRDDIFILLVGDGQLREQIDQSIQLEGLPNIRRLDLIPKIQLVNLLKQAVVSLVPLKGTPVLDHSSPNKLFESLLAGVPVIQTTQGWIKRFVEENGIGFTVSPQDPEALAELLIYIFDNQSKIQGMRVKAQQIASERFDKNILAEKMIQSIQALL